MEVGTVTVSNRLGGSMSETGEMVRMAHGGIKQGEKSMLAELL
jgi:hypothetical protein